MFRGRACYCVLCALIGLAVAWFLLLGEIPTAVAQGKSAKGAVSFIDDVAPILKDNCYACHDAKKKKGKLDMSNFESLRKGGTKDDPIVPGKSRESYLMDVLIADGPERMPPKDSGDRLSKAHIETIARWIDQGAKLDAGVDPKADILRELRKRWTPPKSPATYKYPATINALAFTPDGKKLVAGGYHELTVWNLDGTLDRRIATRAERAYGMVFLPNGTLAVAGGRPGQEGDVRIYDIAAGTDGVNDTKVFVKELGQADDSMLALALSGDGKRLASAGCDRVIRVWDLATGKLEQSIENHADWVLGLAFSADGKMLATASRDKSAKLWDLAAMESLATFAEHQSPVTAVAISPDGKSAISTGEDGNIRFWNATDEKKNIGKQTKSLPAGKAALRLAVDFNGKIAAAGCADGKVMAFDTVGGNPRPLAGLNDWVYAVALSPDGSLVAGGAWNGEVRIWKTKDGSVESAFNASPGYVPPAAAEAKAPPAKKKS